MVSLWSDSLNVFGAPGRRRLLAPQTIMQLYILRTKFHPVGVFDVVWFHDAVYLRISHMVRHLKTCGWHDCR